MLSSAFVPVVGSTFTGSTYAHSSLSVQRKNAVTARRRRVSTMKMQSVDGENPNLPKVPQGFTSFSEMLNGRAAMLGFTLAVVTELITGRGMLGQVGSVFEIVNMASALAN